MRKVLWMLGALGLLTTAVNRIRQAVGIGIGTTMIVICAGLYALAWFFVCLVVCIVMITVAPVIVTWLPDVVMGSSAK